MLRTYTICTSEIIYSITGHNLLYLFIYLIVEEFFVSCLGDSDWKYDLNTESIYGLRIKNFLLTSLCKNDAAWSVYV